jgi:hypothetical protein
MRNSSIEMQNGRKILWCFFYLKIFMFFEKTKILIYGGISKFLKLIVFGQILAGFGSFGQLKS